MAASRRCDPPATGSSSPNTTGHSPTASATPEARERPSLLETIAEENLEEIRDKEYLQDLRGRTVLHGMAFDGKDAATVSGTSSTFESVPPPIELRE